MRSFICALAVGLAGFGGSVAAAPVTWHFEIGGTSSLTRADETGSLIVTLDSDDTASQNSFSYFDSGGWTVTDFQLTLDGVGYEASADSETWGVISPGSYTQELYYPGGPNEMHQIGLDLQLADGRDLYFTLRSRVGNGQDPFYLDGDVFNLIDPIGALTNFEESTISIFGGTDGTNGTRYVNSWTDIFPTPVPEVTTTGSVAALASVFALMALLFERRGGSRRQLSALGSSAPD